MNFNKRGTNKNKYQLSEERGNIKNLQKEV